MLGWPFETGVTLSRFIFSKIMDTYPNLKIVSHHLGGVIPYLEGRIGHSFDQMGARTSDEDYEGLRKSLKKRPFDYFKDFYGDTAIEGVRAPMVCGIDFFGADHVLFASDCPFDKEKGPGYIRSTIAVLESLDLKPADREKISYKQCADTVRREVTAAPRSEPCVAGTALANERGSSMLARTQLSSLKENVHVATSGGRHGSRSGALRPGLRFRAGAGRIPVQEHHHGRSAAGRRHRGSAVPLRC